MRKARQQFGRQADAVGNRIHLCDERAAFHIGQQLHRLGDGIERGIARVQAVGRVLKHHLNFGAVRAACKILGRHAADIPLVEHNRAVGRIEQARKQAHQSRFAAAGFADQPDRFTPLDPDRHIIDRMQIRPLGRLADQKALVQANRFKQHRIHAATPCSPCAV